MTQKITELISTELAQVGGGIDPGFILLNAFCDGPFLIEIFFNPVTSEGLTLRSIAPDTCTSNTVGFL